MILTFSPLCNVPTIECPVPAPDLIFKLLLIFTTFPVIPSIEILEVIAVFEPFFLTYSLETYPSLPLKIMLYQPDISPFIVTSCPFSKYPTISVEASGPVLTLKLVETFTTTPFSVGALLS